MTRYSTQIQKLEERISINRIKLRNLQGMQKVQEDHDYSRSVLNKLDSF